MDDTDGSWGDGSGSAVAEASSGFDRLSQRAFHRLAGFIQEYSGIRMPPNKMILVEGRLRRRVRVGHALTDALLPAPVR